MNKLFTKIATAFVGMAMAIGVGVAVGNNSTKMTRVDAASPQTLATSTLTGDSTDGNISWSSIQGSSGTAPGTYNSAIRLYQNGGFIQLKGNNGVKITSFTAHTTGTYATTANYAVSESAFSTSTTPSNAGDDTAVSKNGTYYISDLNSTYVAIICRGTDKNTRFEISSIDVTYQATTIAVTGVSVSPTATSIGVGGTQQLTPTISPANATDKAVTYSSNAIGVAEVSNTGLITAVAAGSATITVTTHDGGFTATCAVTVTAPIAVTGVSLNKNTTTIEINDTETLTATVAPNNASNKTVNWSTSDADVATVADGVVTAVGKGTATITATTVDGGYTATCSVKVTTPSSVTFIAGTDTGESSVTKSGVTISMSTMSRNDNYRCYANTNVSISSSTVNIDSITFTFDGANYTGGFETNYINIGSTSWTSEQANGQARFSQIVVTLESNEPSVELAPASVESVSMMKGDTNTGVKVLVKNIETPSWTFTFDEDEEEGLETSSYISVSQSALVDNISTLTITTKAVGSTTLHISVSGTDCEDSVPVTVNAKPASMTIVHSDIVAGELEIQNGAYKQVSFSGEDTDGNPYSIAAGDVDDSITSGNSYVSISGTRITGTAVGTAVVRYTLKALTSVYAEVTVNVANDYKTEVNSITFNSNLTATQGESVDTSEVFATKVADTHFESTAQIADNELLFTYENNRNTAVAINMFSYDFSHGTTVDATHKSQVVYVFVTFDENYAGTSFSITVEQANDPLTAITLTNAEIQAGEVDITRGGSLQLTWALTPTNPTDGRELEFSVDDSDEGVKVNVSSAGLISVAGDSGLGSALILVEAAHNHAINTYLTVNVELEDMTYQIDEEESWVLATSLTAGDRVAIVYENGNTLEQLSGISSNIGQHQSYSEEGKPSSSYIYTVGTGNAANSYTFSSGTSYLAYTNTSTSGNNNLYYVTNPSTVDQLNQVSWTIDFNDFTITNVYNVNRTLRWNTGSPRFCCYTSGQAAPKIYKLAGGLSSKDVTETLFNAIHNSFGEDKTYEWDENCASFNSSNWNTAGSAVTGIASFSSYKLNRAVADANGNEIERFLAKYDVVIDKFGTTYDFLGRFTEGGINYNARIVNPTIIGSNNSSTVVIIVLVSLVSLSAIGGYFFLRRRKED